MKQGRYRETCFTSEYIGIGGISEEGYAGSLGATPDLHPRIERAALSPVALREPVLGGGRSPLLAGLHQLLDSGHQGPLLVTDLPDSHDGNTHHGGEGDTPTQHVGPVGKDVTVISAAFVVDPAEDQDQLKEKVMSKKQDSAGYAHSSAHSPLLSLGR